MKVSLRECWNKAKKEFAEEIERNVYVTLKAEMVASKSFSGGECLRWNLYVAGYGHSQEKDSFIEALEAMKLLREKTLHPSEKQEVEIEE